MSFFTKFIKEVSEELRRTTWPWDPKERGLKRYKELIYSTGIVFVAMILLAGWITTWDTVFVYFQRFLNWVA
jgi:preprotein translocase subunit SecE